MRLQDKVVVVTASSRGIGLAAVKVCAREGASVYMAVLDPDEARPEAEALVSEGLRVRLVHNDATRPETYASMIDEVIRDAGRIDVLVNNFGASNPQKDRDFAHTGVDAFLDTVTLNLRSVYLGSQLAAQHMAVQGGGSIVNISSVSSAVPDISQVGYGVSKAAINHLTKLIAVQEAAHGIRCNAILPGMTATDSVKNRLSPTFRDLFLRHIPLQRMALPEEIAAAVVYFASDESAYATGQLLTLSGGFGLATPVYAELRDQTERR